MSASGARALRLPQGRAGQAVAVALLVVVAALAWAAVGAPLLEWHEARADALDRRRTLARRMAQVAAELPGLQAAAAAPRAGVVSIVVLQGASDAVAAAALQQLVQEMAAQAGTALASTETVPAQQLGGYRQIGLRVTLNAPWPALVRLLRAIHAASPQMLVDDLQVRGNAGFIHDAAAPLAASMTVLGFRAGSAGP